MTSKQMIKSLLKFIVSTFFLTLYNNIFFYAATNHFPTHFSNCSNIPTHIVTSSPSSNSFHFSLSEIKIYFANYKPSFKVSSIVDLFCCNFTLCLFQTISDNIFDVMKMNICTKKDADPGTIQTNTDKCILFLHHFIESSRKAMSIGIPFYFCKSYLDALGALLSKYADILKLELISNSALALLRDIDINLQKMYMDVFKLHDKINKAEFLAEFNALLKINDFKKAFLYLKDFHLASELTKTQLKSILEHYVEINAQKTRNALNAKDLCEILRDSDSSLQREIIDLLVKKKIKKAAESVVKTLELNPADFGQLVELGMKEAFKYFYRECPWQKLEVSFKAHPKMLHFLVVELFNNKKGFEALGVMKRNNMTEEFLAENNKEFFKMNKDSPNIIRNCYIDEDYFGPFSLDKEGHINKSFVSFVNDFKWNENQVLLIDKIDTETEKVLDVLLQADYVGIDSEFTTGFTTFDKSLGSTIQISSKDLAVVLDCVALGSNEKIKCFLSKLLKQERPIKLGHSIHHDISNTIKSFELSPDVHKERKNIIDVVKLFKSEKNGNKTSLEVMCEELIGKRLCKFDQVGGWDNRPLKKTQLHYGAMDAYILIPIYEEIKRKQGNFNEKEYLEYCNLEVRDMIDEGKQKGEEDIICGSAGGKNEIEEEKVPQQEE